MLYVGGQVVCIVGDGSGGNIVYVGKVMSHCHVSVYIICIGPIDQWTAPDSGVCLLQR